MNQTSCYYFSFTDDGIAYQLGNRLFNFCVDVEGDHVRCELSIHIVELGESLGGGRALARIRVPNIGKSRFRIPSVDGAYDVVQLMLFVESDQFQEFANGPLDCLSGYVDPGRFGMMSD